MKITIPRWLVAAWDVFCDHINKPVYRRVRRIDVLMALFFIVCVVYYYMTGGWLLALQGAAMYIFLAMIALWFF